MVILPGERALFFARSPCITSATMDCSSVLSRKGRVRINQPSKCNNGFLLIGWIIAAPSKPCFLLDVPTDCENLLLCFGGNPLWLLGERSADNKVLLNGWIFAAPLNSFLLVDSTVGLSLKLPLGADLFWPTEEQSLCPRQCNLLGQDYWGKCREQVKLCFGCWGVAGLINSCIIAAHLKFYFLLGDSAVCLKLALLLYLCTFALCALEEQYLCILYALCCWG